MLPECVNVVPPPDKKQQLKEITDQLNAAQTKLTSSRNAKDYDFTQAQNPPPGVPPPTYAEWYKSSGWEARIESDEANVVRLAGIQSDIVKQQNPGYKNAIDASTMPTTKYESKPGFAKCSVSGSDDWRANYILSNGQDWIEQLTQGGGMPLNFSIDASENSSNMTKSWAGGSTDLGDFFGIFANGSWQKMNITQKDNSVKVEINVKAATQVPIAPDSWYNAGYLKTLASKGDWNYPFTTAGGKSPVFGEGGIMPLMITGLVAGYQPQFTITMNSSAFSEYKDQFSVATGIRIGPFHFGGSYSSKTDDWKKNMKDGTFSGVSTATYPFIIGFTVARPGLD